MACHPTTFIWVPDGEADTKAALAGLVEEWPDVAETASVLRGRAVPSRGTLLFLIEAGVLRRLEEVEVDAAWECEAEVRCATVVAQAGLGQILGRTFI